MRGAKVIRHHHFFTALIGYGRKQSEPTYDMGWGRLARLQETEDTCGGTTASSVLNTLQYTRSLGASGPNRGFPFLTYYFFHAETELFVPPKVGVVVKSSRRITSYTT